MRIDLSFRPSLDCNYHCGSDLAQQWIDFCESLKMPNGVSLAHCHESEGQDNYYIIVSVDHNYVSHKSLTAWLESIGGDVENADLFAALVGCANDLEMVGIAELLQVEASMEAGDPDLKRCELAIQNARHEGQSWMGQDEDGYYFYFQALADMIIPATLTR